MKKLLLLAIFSGCFILSGVAQDEFEFTGIVEHFTNSRCGICAANNPDFYAELDMRDDYIHIAYHPKFPYSNCELYQANPSGNQAKLDVYTNIFGTPTVILNGTMQQSAGNVNQNSFESALRDMSSVNIDLEISSESVSLDITNNSFDEKDTDFRVFVAVVEDPLNYNAPNGEDVHHDVFRNWLSSPQGDEIIEQNETIMYNFDLENVSVESNAKVIAYVQEMESLEIYNAAEATPEITSVDENTLEAKVYPTVVSDKLFVDYDRIGTVLNSRILTLDGRVVQSSELDNSGVSIISIENLSAGFYILELRSNKNTSKRVKFIVQ